MPNREELQEALMHAARALYESGNAATIVGPLGDGVYVAIGEPDTIRRMLPDDAANDEVAPAGN